MKYSEIKSKQQLLSTIQNLVSECPQDWENTSANDFIEALGAWLNDADAFYRNNGIKLDTTTPSWQLFADALQAARYYE